MLYLNTKQNSKQKHVTGAKRGKTRVTRIVIGFGFVSDCLRRWREFFKTNHSAVRQNQSNIWITSDAQLNTALFIPNFQATLEMKGVKEMKALLDILELDSSVYVRIQVKSNTSCYTSCYISQDVYYIKPSVRNIVYK